MLGMSRARHEGLAGRAEGDLERLEATHYLVSALQRNDKLAEALPLAREALSISRHVHGAEHAMTVDTTEALAGVHRSMGNLAARAPTPAGPRSPPHPVLRRALPRLAHLASAL